MKKRFNLKLVASIVLLGVLVLNIQYALTGYNGADVFARQTSQSGTSSSDATSSAGFLGNETYSSCGAKYDYTYTGGQTLVFTYNAGASVTNLSYIGSASAGYGVSYTYYSTGSGVIQAEKRDCPGYLGLCTHQACGEH